MGLLDKVNGVAEQAISRELNNLGERASSAIPNITSGLDIADNGLVKGLITDGINSIIKSGKIGKGTSPIIIAGPKKMLAVDQSESTVQFVKLTLLKSTFIADPTTVQIIKSSTTTNIQGTSKPTELVPFKSEADLVLPSIPNLPPVPIIPASFINSITSAVTGAANATASAVGIATSFVTDSISDAAETIFGAETSAATITANAAAAQAALLEAEKAKTNSEAKTLANLKTPIKSSPKISSLPAPRPKKNLNFTESKKDVEKYLLPFPQDITIETSPNWGDIEGGILGEILLKSKVDLNSTLASLKNVADNIGDKSGELRQQAKANITRAGVNTIGSAIFGTQEASRFLEAASGKLFNPREVVLFEGIKHRTFNVSFNFSPTSKKESQDLRDFLISIHEHAVPDIEGPYFTYPSFFSFQILNANREPILDRGEVVINSLNCNYTPDGVWASFRSGQPIHVTLDVSFQERELPTRRTIKRLFGAAA